MQAAAAAIPWLASAAGSALGTTAGSSAGMLGGALGGLTGALNTGLGTSLTTQAVGSGIGSALGGLGGTIASNALMPSTSRVPVGVGALMGVGRSNPAVMDILRMLKDYQDLFN